MESCNNSRCIISRFNSVPTFVAEPPLGVNATIKFADKKPVPLKVKFDVAPFIILQDIASNVGITSYYFYKSSFGSIINF